MDVSGSQLITDPAKGRYQRALGVGSTLVGEQPRPPRSRLPLLPAHRHGGDRHTRHRSTSRFWLTGTRHYRNADRVVHLYNYLLAGARRPPCETGELGTRRHSEPPPKPNSSDHSKYELPLTLNATDGHALVDADGFAIDGRGPTGYRLLPATGAGHVDDHTDRNNTAQSHRPGADRSGARGGATAIHPGRAGRYPLTLQSTSTSAGMATCEHR